MSTITKYLDPQGAEITTDWWADAEGTRHLVRALSDERRAELSMTTTRETLPDPEPPSVAEAAESVCAKMYKDCDAVYVSVIGYRQAEYDETERQALIYKAEGFEGNPPPYVQSFVSVSGMTPSAATDYILEKAANWRKAAGAMRSSRFKLQAEARMCTTHAEVLEVGRRWSVAMSEILQSIAN